jgi:uncharacterized metal-binding protein
MDNSKNSTCGSTCGCSKGPKIIYPCSGASDVGELADRAARKLSAEGAGKMSCIVGIGGRVGAMMDIAKAASKILVIDGCPQDCARKSLEAAGYANFDHLRLYELGFAKGKSPASDSNIEMVLKAGRNILIK